MIPGEFKEVSFAENIQVVLVHPQQSLNIGSVARAMMNLGFKNLRIIKPENFDAKKAAITARWATPIVEAAPHFENLKAALQDCHDVIGFGGRYDDNKIENISLPAWLNENNFKPNLKTALVFGPEDRGLNTDEISHCHFLVRIPSASDYPSYNLAQAVLIALYELSRTDWESKITGREEREMPTQNEFFHLERILDVVLTNSGFYRQGTPQPVPGVIKRLFQRMNPDKREMGILLAMVSRLEKSIK